MTKVNSNNGNETKSDIFHGTYSNLASFFIGRKILKYFNDFFNWHFCEHKEVSKHKEIKGNKINFLQNYLQSSGLFK